MRALQPKGRGVPCAYTSLRVASRETTMASPHARPQPPAATLLCEPRCQLTYYTAQVSSVSPMRPEPITASVAFPGGATDMTIRPHESIAVAATASEPPDRAADDAGQPREDY